MAAVLRRSPLHAIQWHTSWKFSGQPTSFREDFFLVIEHVSVVGRGRSRSEQLTETHTGLEETPEAAGPSQVELRWLLDT